MAGDLAAIVRLLADDPLGQQRRGIGSRMLRWAIERARQRGCGLLQLTTHASRVEARRFYERLGFVGSHLGMKLQLVLSCVFRVLS